MLVRDRMSRKIIAVTPRDTVEHASKQMRARGVRHLPVLRGARLVGILSDRDLRRIDGDTLVENAMTAGPISIPPDASLDEGAWMMHTRKVSSLPVVERGRVVGILTTTDVLRAFVDLSGAAEPTTRLVITAPGRGAETTIRRIVHTCHGELRWIHRRGQHVHLRLADRRVDDILSALEADGFEVTTVVRSRELMRNA